MKDRTFPESGMALFDMIEKKIKTEDKVIINLEGVVSLPSMFLNVSIGKFIETYGVDLLKQKISFSQISATQAEQIKTYINKISRV